MSHGQVEFEADDKVRCDACPVTCYIRPEHGGGLRPLRQSGRQARSGRSACPARAEE